MARNNDHPETVLMIVAVTAAIGLALLMVPTPPPPPPMNMKGQPQPSAREIRDWTRTPCDRCRKPLTMDMQDGMYLIGGEPYLLHKGCVGPVARAARR